MSRKKNFNWDKTAKGKVGLEMKRLTEINRLKETTLQTKGKVDLEMKID